MSTRARPPLESLVTAATWAASSHNTQPWKFELEDDRIRILPDWARRCPEVDPDDHHLYASLGCATENLIVAARARGWDAETSIEPSPTGHIIDIALRPSEPVSSPLADALTHRQCTRRAYDGRPVPAHELRALEDTATGDGVSPLLITDSARMHIVADYVARGNTEQIEDHRWREELISWIRFNEREARRKGDGLWAKSTGNPQVPRPLGKLLMKVVLTPKSQNDKDVPWIHSSAGIVVFASQRDDPEHWIEAGRCYERFALHATALGIRHAFVNQPVEVGKLRGQFATWLGLGEQRPDLVVRFGYGPAMPPSKRRPVQDVIVGQRRHAMTSMSRSFGSRAALSGV